MTTKLTTETRAIAEADLAIRRARNSKHGDLYKAVLDLPAGQCMTIKGEADHVRKARQAIEVRLARHRKVNNITDDGIKVRKVSDTEIVFLRVE